MQVRITEGKTVLVPRSVEVVLGYDELIAALANVYSEFPKGGMYELKFDPNTERVVITCT